MTSRLTIGLLLVSLAVAAAAAPPERVVRYANDTLTVRLTDAPLAEVLDEIGHQAGAEIQGHVVEARQISADFDAVPLPEALHRLLGDQNFALIYGEKGLKTVKLLGEAKAPVPSATPAAPARVTPPKVPSGEVVSSYLDRLVQLPVDSRLAQLLGNRAPPLRRVLEVGLKSDDRSVRLEAVRAGLQMVDRNPDLRTALSETLVDTDDVTLSGILRSSSGDHAEEVANLVVSETKAGIIRLKANTILRTIRAGQ